MEIESNIRDIDIECSFCDRCKNAGCCFNWGRRRLKPLESDSGLICELCEVDLLRTEKMLNQILEKKKRELYLS